MSKRTLGVLPFCWFRPTFLQCIHQKKGHPWSMYGLKSHVSVSVSGWETLTKPETEVLEPMWRPLKEDNPFILRLSTLNKPTHLPIFHTPHKGPHVLRDILCVFGGSVECQ